MLTVVQSMVQSTFGRCDVFRPFPLTFGRWDFAVVLTERPQNYCGSVLHFLQACPPLEGGTISRVNCAPSEGEDVSENVAAQSLYAVAEGVMVAILSERSDIALPLGRVGRGVHTIFGPGL